MFKIEGKPRKNFRVRLSDKSIALPIYVDEEIGHDPGLWNVYKANIAVQFQDSAYWFKQRNNKHYLNTRDLHMISNEAADNFLKLWTRQ